MDQSIESKLRVFISYSRRDGALANSICARLIDSGFEAYIDTEDIVKGEPWKERLASLILQADAVVFLISPDSVSSPICEWEVNEAERHSKRILPVVARHTEEDEIPSRLLRLNFTILTEEGALETEYAKLNNALLQDAQWVREHTRLAELASRWDLADRAPRLLLRGPDIEAAEEWRSQIPSGDAAISSQHHAFIQASRKQSGRRQRVWITSIAAISILMAGLAAFGLYSRSVALENEKRAVAAQAQTEQALNSLIFEVAQDLKDVEGVSRGAIVRILTQAEASIDTLLATDPENTALTRNKAAAHLEFADIYMRSDDYARAQRSFSIALSIYDEILQVEPENRFALEMKAGASLGLNELERRMGVDPERRASIFQALDTRRATFNSNPADFGAQIALASALAAAGDFEWELGNRETAASYYEEALGLYDGVSGSINSNALRNQAAILSRTAEMAGITGDRSREGLDYEKSLEITRRLIAREPENAMFRRDLVAALTDLAKFELSNGTISKALLAFGDAVSTAKDLASSDEENSSFRYTLAITLLEQGIALNRTDRRAEAEDVLEAASETAKPLLSAHEESAEYISIFVSITEARARLFFESGQHERAKTLIEDALGGLSDLQITSSGSADALYHESLLRIVQTDVFVALGDLESAAIEAERANTILADLVNQDSKNMSALSALGSAKDRLGDLALRGNDRAYAESLLEESRVIREEAHQANPNDRVAARNLVVHYLQRSQLYLADEDFVAANAVLERANPLNKRLLEWEPNNVDFILDRDAIFALQREAAFGENDIERAILLSSEASAGLKSAAESNESASVLWRAAARHFQQLGALQFRKGDFQAARQASQDWLDAKKLEKSTAFVPPPDLDVEIGIATLRLLQVSDPASHQELLEQAGMVAELPSIQSADAVLLNEFNLLLAQASAGLLADQALQFAMLEDYDSAFELSRGSLSEIEALLDSNMIDQSAAAGAFGNHAWYALMNADPIAAEEAARRGIALDNEQTWIEVNLTHALMFQGRMDEVFEYHETRLHATAGSPPMPWAEAAQADFDALEAAGVPIENINSVREFFAKKSQRRESSIQE